MGFPGIQGQERPARLLARFLETGRMPQALLFHGPEGVGKTLTAVAFTKALLCKERTAQAGCGLCPDCQGVEKRTHPDFKLVDSQYQAGLKDEDPAKQRILGVETLRHLRKDMELGSMLGSWKIALLPEAHTMAHAGANALLKVIEEPPPKTLWILVTPRRESLPRTVLSRTFPVAFAPLPADIVREILLDRGVDAPSAESLSRLCDGSVSRALELWDAGLPAADDRDPFTAAEGLPRELHQARRKTELAIYCHEQSLLLRVRAGELDYGRATDALRELGSLRRALRANVDPGTVLTLAHLNMEGTR